MSFSIFLFDNFRKTLYDYSLFSEFKISMVFSSIHLFLNWLSFFLSTLLLFFLFLFRLSFLL
nr:MAG TPA: hypothetical protein [Caudoviricetes sp.]